MMIDSHLTILTCTPPASAVNRYEICKILDVSRTNLGVLLYRSRNRLRECLETKGFRE